MRIATDPKIPDIPECTLAGRTFKSSLGKKLIYFDSCSKVCKIFMLKLKKFNEKDEIEN